MKREYAIDKLIENANKCVNMLDLCHKMGIKNVGGEDYKEVRDLAKSLNIKLVFSYLKNIESKNTKLPLSQILVENSEYKSSNNLKRRLIKEGVKKCECELCHLTEWLGKPISLQLHHINGKHNDNRLENLMILCPNCHSQTDTYAGRNCNTDEGTQTHTVVKKRRMKLDEWEVLREEVWIKNHPSKETLINLFIKEKSFVKMGKIYNVSDKTISKWFKHHGLPYKKQELKKYVENIL